MNRTVPIAFVVIAALVAGAGWFLKRPASHDNQRDDSDLRGLAADMGRSTNLLATGEWSQPVTDSAGYTLRGRLLLFEPAHYTNTFPGVPPTEIWNNPSVYLELQNLSPRKTKNLAVYFSIQDGLSCQLRDSNGRPPPNSMWGFSWDGPITPFTRQQWTTVPFDGAVRLRADVASGGTSTSPTNLHIMFGWTSAFSIPAGTNCYYLSGSFSPTTNHPPPPGMHVWNGVLNLPPVKIPQPKP